MFIKIQFFLVLGTMVSLAMTQVCRNVGATCSSCSTLSICVSINSSAILANCTRPTPYCNAGACSTIPGPAGCSKDFPSFACPEEDGSYPDGSSCNMYHICLDGKAYNYTCSIKNSVYSPGSGSCVRHTQLRSCHKAKCSPSAMYAIYPGDHTLFFLCVNSKPTLVLRCAKGLRFDQALQNCVVNCENEGKFADPTGNSTTFVECTMTGPATFATVMRTCPPNSLFDEKILECVLPQSAPAQQKSVTVTKVAESNTKVLYGSVRGYRLVN